MHHLHLTTLHNHRKKIVYLIIQHIIKNHRKKITQFSWGEKKSEKIQCKKIVLPQVSIPLVNLEKSRHTDLLKKIKYITAYWSPTGCPFLEPDMTPCHHHTTKSTLTKFFPLKFLDFFDRRRPMQPNLTTNSARPGEDSPVIRTRKVRRVRGRVSESIAPRFQRPPLSHGWHLCFINKIRDAFIT